MKKIIYDDKIIGNLYQLAVENRNLYIYIRQDNGIIVKKPYIKYKIKEVS